MAPGVRQRRRGTRATRALALFGAALCCWLAAPAAAPANWRQPFPGPLNVDATKNVSQSINPESIVNVGGVPYVAWIEDLDVFVARFTGSTWAQVGSGPLNIVPLHPADHLSITTIGGVPYVTWDEFNGSIDQVFVKRFSGGVWKSVGGALNKV